MKLHYTVSKNEGIPVVFLHGNSLDGSIFVGVSPFNKNDYKLYGVDLPGHGLSPQLGNYTLQNITDTLCDFLNYRFNEEYVLVAHSLSGHIALQGLHKLNTIAGLFLCGTPPLESLEDMATAFNAAHSQLLFKTQWNAEELDELSALLSSNKPEIIQQALVRCDRAFKSDFVKPPFLENLKNEHEIVRNITIPVKITWGTDDQFVNARYFRHKVMQIHNSNLSFHEFDRGGHCPFLDAPEVFYLVLDKFISSLR